MWGQRQGAIVPSSRPISVDSKDKERASWDAFGLLQEAA